MARFPIYLIYFGGVLCLSAFTSTTGYHQQVVGDFGYNYKPVGHNVAKGKKTGQKTTYGDAVSGRAVDGGHSGIFKEKSCTHTGPSRLHTAAEIKNPYWWVKLTENDYDPSELVGLVTVFNREDCCWHRLSKIEIRVLETCDFCNDSTDVDVTPGPEETAFAREDMSTLCFRTDYWVFPGKNDFLCQNGLLRGRYVVIRIETSEPLTLCEVEVFQFMSEPDDKAVNIAKGRPAEQSSTGDGGVASRAVDGYKFRSGFYDSCSQTDTMCAAGSPPWWRVELVPCGGEPVEVEKVRIIPRLDCCFTLNGFSIWVGNEETGEYDLCYYVEYFNPGVPMTLTCGSVLHGTHVKITLPKPDVLTLCEVEVFGPAH